MLTEQFGRRLKYWRQKRGLTQDEVAKRCHIDFTAVSHYEHGRRNPTLYTVEKFLTALNVSITDFFEEADGLGHDKFPAHRHAH